MSTVSVNLCIVQYRKVNKGIYMNLNSLADWKLFVPKVNGDTEMIYPFGLVLAGGNVIIIIIFILFYDRINELTELSGV